jgi:ParB-like chromosome segregation protein Spo0J
MLTRANGAEARLPELSDRPAGNIVAVPILSLRPGDSARLEGEDKAHIARLAEAEAKLPPILVDRRSMRVIDGMHRLLAASLNGQETVEVVFFDGSPAEAFLRGVEANVTHGLPLSHADRRAAAMRVVASHPQMSDRAIGHSTGLSGRTVATIRRSAGTAQLDARVGRDGRVRPLNAAEGRRQAAAALTANPGAPLREVARLAGVSPATARDVRLRLERGEAPTLSGRGSGRPASDGRNRPSGAHAPGPSTAAPSAPLAVEKLLRDPSLRHSEHGRQLLRLLQLNAAGAQDWPDVVAAVPPHCAAIVGGLARHYAQKWLDFAQELDQRARIIDPGSDTRVSGRSSWAQGQLIPSHAGSQVGRSQAEGQ